MVASSLGVADQYADAAAATKDVLTRLTITRIGADYTFSVERPVGTEIFSQPYVANASLANFGTLDDVRLRTWSHPNHSSGAAGLNATFDNYELCVHFFINAGLNDAWFNLATAGQGFFFVVFPDIELFFLSWFTYDVERPDESIEAILGEPGHRWVTAFGAWEGDTVTLDVELTSGGIFDSAEPMVEQESNYGTITIVFHDCNNATLTYDFPTLGLSGTIELTRVTDDNVALCEKLNAALQNGG